MPSTPGTPFGFGTRLGLVFVVEAASLSALAVTGVLLYIGVNKVAAFCAWPSQYSAVMNKNPPGGTSEAVDTPSLVFS